MARMNRPAPVEVTYKNMRFLITHNPTNATLNKFIEELKKYGVTTIVRVCEATYDTTLVEKEGIHVLDWPFDDGAPPSNQIVDDWLSLVKIKFREEPGCCIAVHCVAGLGRAPVLVALALIEGGMKYEDAVQFIRQHFKVLQRLKGYLQILVNDELLTTHKTPYSHCDIKRVLSFGGSGNVI
ncbi:protein tyrosine phosphatase type IVA 1 isoform X1 [Oryctolagus cuniculus]|uniref:protein-tyrosine-phosphatase n=1 Tax=Oryctolagus cuniculus TaxID=9986 RepID=A0A5F9D0H4_RABIT